MKSSRLCLHDRVAVTHFITSRNTGTPLGPRSQCYSGVRLLALDIHILLYVDLSGGSTIGRSERAGTHTVPWPLVRKRTIPTELPPLVDET
jgi:hypothetical protein